MRLSELPAEHVTRLFFLAYEHFRGCGYPDAWLVSVAGDAYSRGDQRLARECLSAFEQTRVFYGLELVALRGTSRDGGRRAGLRIDRGVETVRDQGSVPWSLTQRSLLDDSLVTVQLER